MSGMGAKLSVPSRRKKFLFPRGDWDLVHGDRDESRVDLLVRMLVEKRERFMESVMYEDLLLASEAPYSSKTKVEQDASEQKEEESANSRQALDRYITHLLCILK